LIEQFHYPKLGPGLMWERCAEQVVARGGQIRMRTALDSVRLEGGRATSVVLRTAEGEERLPVSHLVSSMPLTQLVRAVDPPAPPDVLGAAQALHYRDFLTVALVVPEARGFPDNWIYVHSPEVKVGRIQNFGSWSPAMVKDGRTCLGLEYFVFEGDEIWSMDDEDLVAMAKGELATIGLAEPDDVEAGYVVRMPKAYPVYDEDYGDHVEVIRRWLERAAPNVHPVGRNGMHKYNNQDHSMYTAMLTVENIHGASHDIWSVNVEDEYHETAARAPAEPAPRGEGPPTGRAAPTLPRRRQPVGQAAR
ncbi:MAG TPA: FAD-dependent oxidoreductase, partial [Acidimicrobiales bacterium]|nr:FAD-dependent oxidoreductase [Acidimicrobiales bacterium]